MIKKLLPILIFCLLFLSCPAISQNSEDCTDYPSVSRIEKTILGRAFAYENIYQRVNRLESRVLGTNFPNDALCDRIDRIAKAASSSDAYAYNSDTHTAKHFLNQPLSSFSWQDDTNSLYNNGSYNNQYYASSQNSSTLQKILDIAIPILSGLSGNNYGYNNYLYGPGYQQEINRYENSNFGAGVRILP